MKVWGIFAAFALALGASWQPTVAQEAQHQHARPAVQSHEHLGHDMSSMGDTSAAVPAKPRKSAEEIEADKRFSEFNHRFAGIFVLLVGLLSVMEPKMAARFPWIRYFWSALFFIPGVYLLIWSDPESWPIGSQTLSYVIHSNMQVLQHKLFSVLLLTLSAVEFVRIHKRLHSAWISSIFPALAGAGALLLLYHDPTAHAGMGPEAHQTMEVVQHQHLGFALAGFGIALSKGIADVGKFQPRLFRNLFAVMMVVLAGLLMTYAE